MGGVGVTDFVARSLGLLPQPAALWEVHEHRFVGANPQGDRIRQMFPELGTEPRKRAIRALYQALGEAESEPEGTFTAELPTLGFVHISRMPAKPFHTRPDLLLMTAHEGVDAATAWMDHQRMLMALNINEEADMACRQMQTALTQIAASLEATRAMVQTYNDRMVDWFAVSHYTEDSSKEIRTTP